MAKKIVKKRKLRMFGFVVLLLVIGVISFCCYMVFTSRIKNIIITGNESLSDDVIIEKAGIFDYPKYFLTSTFKIKKKLKKIPFIKKVDVKRGFHNTIYINVSEYKVILKKEVNNKYVLSNGVDASSDINFTVPVLVNYVPSKKYKKLIEYIGDIKSDVYIKISELRYDPNEFDKDRFLLYMNDGNSVYLTLTKFEMINYYNEVLPQLEGRRGILYLDSGNHFKIME